MASFGPNVVSFILTPGARQWYVVGSYVPPNGVPAVHHVEQALRVTPKGVEMVLMGDLNVQLGNPHGKHEEELAAALVYRGLVNIIDHFMPQRRYMGTGSWAWCMQMEGWQVTGRGEYSLFIDRNNFTNAGMQESRHGTDHRMTLTVLRGYEALRNRRYRKGRTCWPIRPR